MHAKKRLRKEKLKKIARAHTLFLAIAFGLYIVLSALFGPEFIFSDLRHKFSALADDTITITGKVLGPPVKPIVSGSSFCTNGNLGVSLVWPVDENSETFDIKRNGALLVTGLTDSNYTDSTVVINTTYTYIITAHGSMGPGLATSAPVAFSTLPECNIVLPPPSITINTFDFKNISYYSEMPQTTNQKPSFSGTTNIPYAKITLLLESSPMISTTTYANENGYWSWIDPEMLDIGSHQLYLTATDLVDEAYSASAVFSFEVVSSQKEEASEKNKSKQKTKEYTSATPAVQIISPAVIPTSIPFAITVAIKNQNHKLHSGDDLLFRVDFLKKSLSLTNKNYPISYDILDENNNLISETSEEINPSQNNFLTKSIPLSKLMHKGNYKILVKIYDGKNLISAEDFFRVEELPLLSVGTTSISFTKFMQDLSWVILFLLLLIILFLIALGHENYLSRQALFNITEDILQKRGFFTKRKGVSR